MNNGWKWFSLILAAAGLLQCASPRPKVPKTMNLDPVLSERAYLPSHQKEKTSNWYSYVIIGRQPASPEDTALLIRLHAAFRKVFPLRYERKVEKAEGFYLNRIYWLTSEDPGPAPDSLPDRHFVETYDYARAELFMRGMADIAGDERIRTGLHIVYEDNSLLDTPRLNWQTTFHISLERFGPEDFEKDLSWFRDNIQESSVMKRSIALYRNNLKTWLGRR